MSKILSLCSGYGGLDLAVEEHFADSHTAYWSDIDPSACAVMEARFPDAEPVGDLTQFGDTVFDCDILTAGYPCQPFSHAGKRLGEDDERHLWPYIANTISISRPQWVVLENVAGHLTLGGTSVTGSLASMGYDMRWGIVRASDTGSPHKRARWFCLATYSRGQRHGERENDRGMGDSSSQVESEAQQQRSRQEPEHRVGETQTPTNSTSMGLKDVREVSGLEEEIREPRTFNSFGPYEPAIRRWEQVLGRVAPDPTDELGVSPRFLEWMMGLPDGWVCDAGLESRTAELKMLGNGVVPIQGELALRLLDD